MTDRWDPDGGLDQAPGGIPVDGMSDDDAPIDVVELLQDEITASDDLVDAVLHLVAALAEQTVGGADGASVTLRRRGILGTVAATDQTVMAMDAAQYTSGQGPCVEASMEGRPFHARSLDDESRWPGFIPAARDLGIKAILSSPLLVLDRPYGALNLYACRSNAFAPGGQALAALFASEASNVLTETDVDASDARLRRRLVQALGARESIAQAEGMLMEREGIGSYDAFAMLRRSSMRAGTPLRERAEDMVVSARRALPATGARQDGPSA